MPTTKRRARLNDQKAKAKVGRTINKGGITYKMNKNYRWERVGKKNVKGYDYSPTTRAGGVLAGASFTTVIAGLASSGFSNRFGTKSAIIRKLGLPLIAAGFGLGAVSLAVNNSKKAKRERNSMFLRKVGVGAIGNMAKKRGAKQFTVSSSPATMRKMEVIGSRSLGTWDGGDIDRPRKRRRR